MDFSGFKQTLVRASQSSPFRPYITATVNVVCISCGLKGQRHWEGELIGRGFHGSFNALLSRLRQSARKPLLGIYTIGGVCGCEEPTETFATNQLNVFFKNKPGNMHIGILSEKEIEEVLAADKILMKGVLMNTITTIAVNGELREWHLLYKPQLVDKMYWTVRG
jgi:hypothetical protein